MRPGTQSSGEAAWYLWTPWTRAEAQLPTPTMATRTALLEGAMPSTLAREALSGKRLHPRVVMPIGRSAAQLGRQRLARLDQPFQCGLALQLGRCAQAQLSGAERLQLAGGLDACARAARTSRVAAGKAEARRVAAAVAQIRLHPGKDLGRIAKRNEAVGEARRSFEGALVRTAEPDRNGRSGQSIQADALQRVPAPVESHVRLAPQLAQDLHLFLDALAAPGEVSADCLVFGGVPADADAQLEAAAAQLLQLGRLLGDDRRRAH